MSLLESKKAYFRRTVAVMIVVTILLTIPMISLASGFGTSRAPQTTRYARTLAKEYSGVFSMCVSSSVNPTATLAVLSIVGAVENAAEYSDSVILNNVADFFNGIPVIREAGKIPLSNPYAAIFLVLAAVALIVCHATAIGDGLIKFLKLKNKDQLILNIQNVVLTVLPLLTNKELAANPPGFKGGALGIQSISILGKATEYQGVAWYAYIVAGLTFIGITISSNISFSCFKNADSIAAGMPINGSGIVWQIIKAVLHTLLMVLFTKAPWVCFIICIHLVVASFFLFRFLKRTAQYYTDIYILTIIRRIFMRKKPVLRIEKFVPRRLKKLYPDMEIAMSVYTFHGYARLAKRSRIWLIKEGEKTELIYNRLIRKPYIISWSDLREQHEDKTVYLEQCLRFLRIRTEDKKIELVMSNRYKPEIEMLTELLDLKDYAIVKQENKETKKFKRMEKKMRRKHKKQIVEENA